MPRPSLRLPDALAREQQGSGGVLPTEIARQGGNREVAEDVLLPVFAEVIHVHVP